MKWIIRSSSLALIIVLWVFVSLAGAVPTAIGPINRTAPFNPASTAMVTGALVPGYPVGFPMWYEDINAIRLTHCPGTDPKCISDPAIDATFQIGAEGFFWSADAYAAGAGINGLLVMGIEEAWGGAAGHPTDGDGNQIVFQRLRIRVDVPVAGTYTVTHPFGTQTFHVTWPGIMAINSTDDMGLINPVDPDLAMSGALSGPYDRFLTWPNYQTDPTLFNALTGTRYIGDPLVPHTVTGSPTGNNIFKIVGPGGITAQTDLFTVQGKVFGTVATVAVAVTVPPQPSGLVVTPGTPAVPAALTDPAAVVGAGDPAAGTVILATAPAGFTPVAATTFTATGLPVAPAAPGTATVALTFNPVPANPVFFKVNKGTGKFTKIFPTDATVAAAAAAQGITNVSFNAGTRTLTFTIRDNAPADDNPAQGTVEDPILVGSLDTIPPSVSINEINSSTRINSQTILGAVEAGATLNVTTDTVASDGAANVAGNSWNYTITGLVEGRNGITVTATDAAGNSATVTSSITLDTVPPIITIDVLNSPTKIDSQTISGMVEAGARVTVLTDTAASDGPATINGTTWSYTITGLRGGRNGISVIATDIAGNNATVTSGITLDTNPPAATITGYPGEISCSSGADLIVGGPDVVSYQYKLDNGLFSEEIGITIPISLTNLSNGMHTVSVIGKDPWGNWQSEGSATVATWQVVSPILGDIDGDQNVGLADAIIALKALSGHYIFPAFNLCGDVNGNGKVDLAEVIYILQKLAGLRQMAVNNSPIVNDSVFELPDGSPFGTIIGMVDAIDQDPASTLSYSIAEGNTNNIFAIDSITGQITLNNPKELLYEKTTSYTLRVSVSDGTSVGTGTIIVDIIKQATVKNVFTYSYTLNGQELIVIVNYSQMAPEGTPDLNQLQPRLLEIRPQWDGSFLEYVSSDLGQAALDAQKELALADIRTVTDPPGWSEGRFIIMTIANTNRVAPGELLILRFNVLNSGATTMTWNYERTSMAPEEANDILKLTEVTIR